MAFGGLTGLGPEAIRRLMAQPSSIPFGALNFDPSQMGSLIGGPAFPQQFGPTEAMRLMAPSWGPGYDIPMSPNSPYLPPMRGGGGTSAGGGASAGAGAGGGTARALNAAPLSRSHIAAQRVFDALRGTAGTNPISMPSAAQIQPNYRALTPPGTSMFGRGAEAPRWNDFFQYKGQNGQVPMRPAGAPAFPIDPIQYAEGATSRYPAGASSAFPRAVNPTVNGPGTYPTSAVTAGRSVQYPYMYQPMTQAEMQAALGGGTLPQRTPGATLGGSPVTNAAVNQVDDAVRMSAMQMPRPPVTNPVAGLGPSVTPVTIAGRTATSPATQTLMQRLFPTLSAMRGGGGAAGALRNFATGPGLMRGVGRGIVGGVADNLIGQPLAEQIGEVNGVAGDFASGFSTGAGYGFGFGPAGALVGGLGVGIGNTLTGGGVTDLLNPEPRSPLATTLDQVRSEEYGAQTGLNPSQQESLAQVMEKFAVNDTSVWEDLGIRSPEVQDALMEEFNRLAPDADQETRTRLLQDLATNAFMQGQTENPNSLTQQEPGMGNGGVLDPQSILALQAQAAGLMAPIAADSVAIGDMGHTALSRLAEGLPPEMAQAVMGMATGHQIEGQNSANRYMQQAYSAPQLAALGQQNAMTMQIAQQLQQQAIQSLPQFAQTGGGSIEDLLAGQALTGGGGTGVDADIAAMLQAAG